MSDSVAVVDDAVVADRHWWTQLDNVFCFANWKGGVGKTTCAAHFAAQAAAAGRRVLIVDLNAQGNVALDLGVHGKDGVDDQGRALFTALTADTPLVPVPGVRPNLDLVPGGRFIKRIEGSLRQEMTSQEEAQWALRALARTLAPIAPDYDLVVVDSPPENELLLLLVLCAARFVLAPMKTDEASRLGLRQLAEIFRKARQLNPFLVLLGVVLFATSVNATRVHAAIRENVSDDLGDGVPVFRSFIRHAEALAVLARRIGLLFTELAERGKDNPAFWRELGVGPDKQVTAVNLSKDVEALGNAIFLQASTKRNEMIKAGMWP